MGLLHDTDTNDTHSLHHTTLHYTTPLHQLQPQLQLQRQYITVYITRHYRNAMTLRDTTPLHTQQYRTRQYGTRQRIARMTPHRNDCNCTALIARQHKYNSITLQLASNLLFACLAALLAASLLAFVWHSSGPRAVSQSQNTMAVKDGSGPRPAAQRAKRCFLNCLETSFKPSIQN